MTTSASLLLLLPPREHPVPACSSSTTSQLVVPSNSKLCFLGQQPSAVLVRLEFSLEPSVCLFVPANHLCGNMAIAWRALDNRWTAALLCLVAGLIRRRL
eukprot:3678025-Heterocapsa_arctica.AAC.1